MRACVAPGCRRNELHPLVINLKIAKALGLTEPPSLLVGVGEKQGRRVGLSVERHRPTRRDLLGITGWLGRGR